MGDWQKRRWCKTAGVLAICAIIAGLAAPAAATDEQTGTQPAPVMVTLDASGSMARTLDDGQTRMAAAKTALNSLADSVAGQGELGLQVYGSRTGESQAEKAAGCRDIVTTQPVRPVDPAALNQKVAGIEPSGFTPIGNALRAAASELPADGPRAIVLISDGLDTCAPPDPCVVAEELAADGVELSVHPVGFQVDDRARKQLSCIAEATGGSYTDARNAGDLRDQLPKVVERAQRSYETAGQPITGTEDYPQAPTMNAGQYVDQIDAGQTKYYRLQIPRDYTAHIAATAVIPGDEDDSGVPKLLTNIVDGTGQSCVETYDIVSMWQAHLTSTLSWTGGQQSDECAAGDEVYLAVEREGPDETNYWSYQLELLLTLEPPVTGDRGPEANSTEVPFQQPTGAEQPVTGGGSFNDATELPGSGVYTDSMALGEMSTYKVKLDWGESLAVKTNVDTSPTDDVITVDTSLRDAVRARTSETASVPLTLNAEEGTSDPLSMTRVLYNNRDDGYPSVAGWHYITLESDPGDSMATMPVRLYVSKGGQPVSAPDYQAAPGRPTGPITGGGGDQAAGPARIAATSEQVSTGPAAWVWVLVGVLAAGLATGTVVLLRRAGRSVPHRHY